MQKKLFQNELKTLLILIVFFWIVAFSLFAVSSSILISKSQSENVENNELYHLKDIDYSFFNIIADINTFTELINSNEQKYIDILNNPGASNDFAAIGNKLIGINPHIKGFAIIFGENNYVTYNMPNITSDNILYLQIAFPLSTEKIGEYKWFFSEEPDNSAFSDYIICCSNIFETNKSKLYIFLDESMLNDILQKGKDTANITLMDQNGKIFASSDTETFNQMLYTIHDDVIALYNTENGFIQFTYNYDKYICIHHQSKYTGFKYVEFKKTTNLYENSQRLIIFIVILTLMFIFVTIALYSILKRRFIHPITLLSDEMKDFNQKSLNKKLELSGSPQINIITKSFNLLIDKFNSIIDDVKAQEEQKKNIELNALKSQIRPHFLYNTLNSIRIISLNKGQYDIAKSIQILSKLLRNTVSSYETFTELKNEIESIKYYIELMQLCYDNKINITYDIQPQVEHCQVPSIILQPIIENSINHGISSKLCQENQNATILICAKEDNNRLCISVTDNGAGMTQEQIDVCLNAPIDFSGNSIGLKNLINRIKLLYDDAGSVLIESEPDKYTTVTIYIPI